MGKFILVLYKEIKEHGTFKVQFFFHNAVSYGSYDRRSHTKMAISFNIHCIVSIIFVRFLFFFILAYLKYIGHCTLRLILKCLYVCPGLIIYVSYNTTFLYKFKFNKSPYYIATLNPVV
jgi:hypothetical protein